MLDPRGCARLISAPAVGRLDAQKDHSTLIDAFAQLADSQPDWDLKIIGEGVLRTKLERKIAQLGLQHRIGLSGVVKDISTEYQNAQLFVIPSRYESFSLSTAEALAHGLPIIGFSDCAAIGRLINSANGVLVRADGNRAQSLAGALRPLMEDPELRLRLAASAQPLAEYSLESVLNRWEEIFREVSYERQT